MAFASLLLPRWRSVQTPSPSPRVVLGRLVGGSFGDGTAVLVGLDEEGLAQLVLVQHSVGFLEHGARCQLLTGQDPRVLWKRDADVRVSWAAVHRVRQVRTDGTTATGAWRGRVPNARPRRRGADAVRNASETARARRTRRALRIYSRVLATPRDEQDQTTAKES